MRGEEVRMSWSGSGSARSKGVAGLSSQLVWQQEGMQQRRYRAEQGR